MARALTLRSVRVGESKAKGFVGPGKKLGMIINVEDAAALTETLQGALDSESSVALDIHIGKKDSDDGGTFTAGFMFATDLSQRDKERGGRSQRKKYVPRNPSKQRAQAEAKTARAAAEKALDDDIEF